MVTLVLLDLEALLERLVLPDQLVIPERMVVLALLVAKEQREIEDSPGTLEETVKQVQ